MGLTLVEFEVVSFLHRYGAASPRELCRKIDTVPNNTLLGAIEHLIADDILAQLGTCVSATTPAADNAVAPYRVMRAIILAAGVGERMLPATKNVPKPMVKVNGKQIIKTQLDALLAAGISDITIVRGHNGHTFDVLLEEYPMLHFVENPDSDTTNNIVSTHLVADKLQNAYVIEGDLLVKSPTIIRPFEYRSHYCGKRENVTEDWYFETNGTRITDVFFGTSPDSHQYVGISFWTTEDAKKLRADIESVLQTQGGDQLFLEAVPLKLCKDHYEVHVRGIKHADLVELDTYQELCLVDPSYTDQQSQVTEASSAADQSQI